MQHNLKSRGAAYSPSNLTLIDKDGGTSGIGAALCSCGWVSAVLPSGRARKAAHAEHKKEAERPDVLTDQEMEADLISAGVNIVFKVDEGEGEEPDEVDKALGPDLADPSDLEILKEALEQAKELADSGSVTAAEEVKSITEQIRSLDDKPQVTSRTFDLQGNYSIVSAPATVELAEAFGLEARQENVSAVLRRVHVTGLENVVEHFAGVLDAMLPQARTRLADWQRENRESRKGLTDMQKFLQHRQVLADFYHGFIEGVNL